MHSTKTEVLPNVAIYLGSICVQYECMHFPHISAQISSAQDGSSRFSRKNYFDYLYRNKSVEKRELERCSYRRSIKVEFCSGYGLLKIAH